MFIRNEEKTDLKKRRANVIMIEKFLNLIRRFLAWLDNLLGNLWTGQPSSPPSVAKQEELSIGSDEPPVYRKSKSILTFRERILFSALRKAIENEYWIMSKVRMADFMWISNEPKERKKHLNQILCKHVDFLLCTRIFLKPVLVIELDDPSHQWEGRAEYDRFKDETFASIGLPILRVKMQDRYDPAQLDQQIHELIHSKNYFVQDTDE